MDNVFIERVWRSLKYEEVHLKAYAGGGEARAGAATQKAISIVLICCRCRYVLSPLMFCAEQRGYLGRTMCLPHRT